MTADAPTILATSGGLRPGERTPWAFSPLTHYAVELAAPATRPKVCFLGTAIGDSPAVIKNFYDAALDARYDASHLQLFPMPNLADVQAHLLEQDVIWVTGGSVAGLLALWDLHGLGDMLRTAWQAGVVMTGVSAGSICWHVGGTTDSFGPQLRAITNGLGFVPYSNGVHYDSEAQRRPLFQSLVADGTLPAGFATDDGAGVLYRGGDFAEAVADRDGAGVYRVQRLDDGTAYEERLDTRMLS